MFTEALKGKREKKNSSDTYSEPEKKKRNLERLFWQNIFFHLFLSHKHRRENNLFQT